MSTILRNIRAYSFDYEIGWRVENIQFWDSEHGVCTLCRIPFQHMKWTVTIQRMLSTPFATTVFSAKHRLKLVGSQVRVRLTAVSWTNRGEFAQPRPQTG